MYPPPYAPYPPPYMVPYQPPVGGIGGAGGINMAAGGVGGGFGGGNIDFSAVFSKLGKYKFPIFIGIVGLVLLIAGSILSGSRKNACQSSH